MQMLAKMRLNVQNTIAIRHQLNVDLMKHRSRHQALDRERMQWADGDDLFVVLFTQHQPMLLSVHQASNCKDS